MNLKVYNTRTKEKELFTPAEQGKVKMYVCGVTPYNHPHIGNARPFIIWDVIHRYFERQGLSVTHIQNFTDVDDKIIDAAAKAGIAWDELAGRYIKAYFEVMDSLNVRRVDLYPRVSGHMQEIIDMVRTLVEKGHAYVVDGDVYFSVQDFATYGHLSGRSLDELLADPSVAKTFHEGTVDRHVAVAAPRITGRYVRIQQTLTAYLNLAEVEIWGRP